jgi:hypothetical protein
MRELRARLRHVRCRHAIRSVHAALYPLWERRDGVHDRTEGVAAWSAPTAHGRAT